MNLTKYILCSCICLGLILYSCDSLDDINTDPNNPQEGQLDENHLWASYLITMQRKVIAEDPNDFQLSDDLFGNVYAGYMASTNNWEAGMNSTTYMFPNHWTDHPFKLAYVDFLPTWNAMRQKIDSTSVIFAVGEIVKVQAMHRVTDMYGPIPYSKFGLVHPVPYDSQEEIYKSFLKELEHAVDLLHGYIKVNPTSKALEKYDLIYGGDIIKWTRFANSLALRLAMRIRYVDSKLAQETVEHFAANKYGFMSKNADNASIKANVEMHFNYKNPIYTLWSSYKDQCMGATMDSYLNGFKDPRLPKFFSPNMKGMYKGLRNGIKDGNRYKIADTSKPNIQERTPSYWMTAAETQFLVAEAALLGWRVSSESKYAYAHGMQLSLEQWGITEEDLLNYLINIQEYPSRFLPKKYVGPSRNHDADAPSLLFVNWDGEATNEENLERIITQKWIALYPNGQEAWSEFRRTGYPKIFPILDNMSKGVVDTYIQVRRVPFPKSEYDGNTAEVMKAAHLLKGGDTGGTCLWWDVEKKN